MKKIGVLGAGSWGTALTWLLTNNGHEVTLWSIMEAEVEMLRTKREHTSKLPGVKLQESIQLTSNLEEAMADKDVLVLAVPSDDLGNRMLLKLDSCLFINDDKVHGFTCSIFCKTTIPVCIQFDFVKESSCRNL